jgi:hypothetical protein
VVRHRRQERLVQHQGKRHGTRDELGIVV